MPDIIFSSKSYQELLARLKTRIRTAQVRAAVAVNKELVVLYWESERRSLVGSRSRAGVQRS
jgi:hypothetical protein